MNNKTLARLLKAKYERCVGQIIWQIKRLPKDAMQSGDDSPLKNVWEEWIVQQQGEHSVFYDLYEETFLIICRGVAEKLTSEDREMLWWTTDGALDWEDDEPPGTEQQLNELAEELLRRVNEAAANVELCDRLERYICPLRD